MNGGVYVVRETLWFVSMSNMSYFVLLKTAKSEYKGKKNFEVIHRKYI